MKRLIFILLIAAQSAFGAESVMVDSATRNVINTGVVNFAPNQLKVDNISVIGGAGGGGGGGGAGLPSMPGHNGQFLQTDGSVALWATVDFASLSGKPTTVAGYGITDVYPPQTGKVNYFLQTDGTSVFWVKPVTLAGFGITDAQPLDPDLTAIASLTTQPFGRGALTVIDAPAFRTYIGAGTSNFSGAFSALTGIPTTIAGYGITDAQPLDGDLTSLAAALGTNTIYYRSANNTWSPVTIGTNLTFTGGTLSGPSGLGTGDVSSNVSTGQTVVGQAATFADTNGKLITPSLLNGLATLTGGVLGSTSSIGPTQGGTGQTAVATGDVLYGSGTNTWARLAGPTASTPSRYLRSIGTGSVATAPTWTQPAFSELSGIPTTVSGYGITDALINDATPFSEIAGGNLATARTNLGLQIGLNVQAWDTDLDALAAVGVVAGTGATGTNIAVPFRKLAGPPSTWGTIILGSGLSFDATTGTLTSTTTGSGDVSSPGTTSVDGEVALYSGTSGKTIKRASGTGIATLAAGVLGVTANNSSNWDTAFTDRLKWDGGNAGLNAATGRSSLGASTAGTNLFTLATPGATSWLKVDNAGAVTATNAATTRSDLGLTIGTNVEAWDLDLDQLALFASIAGTGTGSSGSPIDIAIPYRRTSTPTWFPIKIGAGLSFDATTGVLTAIVGGTGDVTSNITSSSPGEVAIFTDTTGKSITHNITNTGVATLAAGVLGSVPQVGPTIGGTGLGTITIGDTIYGSGVNTYGRLVGPIPTTPARYLRSVGNGTTALAPTWTQIPFSELANPPTSLAGYGITDGVAGPVTPPASVDGEIALFSGTSARAIKRATGSGLATVTSGVFGTTANNSASWDTAATNALRWDGGSTGLTASTGRTSLGATTIGTNVFTLADASVFPSFLKITTANAVVAESAATFRTSLGATTTGSNLFTLATPAATSWLQVSNTGVVTATDATTTLTNLDPDLASFASISTTNVIPYRSATNTWGTVTVGAGLTFVGGTLTNALSPASGSISIANSPYTITSADQGKLLSVNAGTNNLAIGLASAAALGSGFHCTLVKQDTGTGSFTANGEKIAIQNQALDIWCDGVIIYSIASWGEFDATGNLTVNGIGNMVFTPGTSSNVTFNRAAIANPSDPAGLATFNASAVHGSVSINVPNSDSTLMLPTDTNTPGAVIDIGSGGTATKRPIYPHELLPQEEILGPGGANITETTHTVSGVVDTIRLAGPLQAPLTIVIPNVTGHYNSGNVLTILDEFGSVSSTNTVTIMAANGTDTFSGQTSVILQEPYGRFNAIANGTNAWTVSEIKTSVIPFRVITPVGNTFTIMGSASVTKLNAHINLLSGVNNIVIQNVNDGTGIELVLVQPASGAAGTVALPIRSKTPSGGAGNVFLSSTNGAIDRIRCSYDGGIDSFLWDAPILNHTSSSTPAPPSSLTVSAFTASTISLSWTDNSTNETAFDIYRCSGASCANFSLLQTVPSNSTTFVDSVSSATSYSYKVRAWNTGGNSTYSNTVTQVTSSGGATADLLEWHFNEGGTSATTVGVAGPSGNLIYPAWTGSAGTQSGCGTCNAFAPVLGMTIVTGQTATPIGTAGLTGYTYKILAFTADGRHNTMVAAPTTTGNAVLNSTNFNRISWTAPSVGSVDHYEVYRTASSGTPSSIGKIGANIPAGTTTLDDTGLAGGGSLTIPSATATNVYTTTAAGTVNYATPTLTVSFWVKATFSVTQAYDIINNGTDGFRIQEIAASKFNLVMPGTTSGSLTGTVSNSALNNGAWHLVTVIFDHNGNSGAGAITVYFDNNATAQTLTVPTLGTTGNNHVGTGNFPTGAPVVGSLGFAGSIDDVRVFTGALTTTQIGGIYTGGAQ